MEINNEKLKIGIDIDEVVTEFLKSYLEFYNKKYNSSLNKEKITNYHLWECGIHKSKEDSINEVMEFQESPSFEKIDLVEGAKEGIKKLSKKFNIYFITSRPENLKDKTNTFFERHFPQNEFKIFFSGEIYGENLSKPSICKNLKISLIIEDNPSCALDCAESGIKVFLLDKPWNKSCKEHENIIRVGDWKILLENLEDLQ